MPGAEKKWGAPEERDLAMAVILAQSGDRPKYDWPKIHETMMSWGYNFSRDAINQHWSKKIMKDFRERHGGNPAGGTTRPSSAASTPRKATPRKRATTTKSKIPVKDEDTEDTAQGEEYDEDSEDLKAQKASIKKQEQQQPAAKKRKLATTSSLEDEFLQPMDDELEI